MIAVQYRKSIPRYLALRAIGPRVPAVYTSRISLVSLRDLPEPPLPTPQWLRIRPTLGGICGSDLATLCAWGSPYLSPVTSTPFVLGHELVGTVSDIGSEVQGISPGNRVVIQPALGCVVRGVHPRCTACAAGRPALCVNVTRGDISAGIQTGYCRDTGGAWSESLVAHRSQVYAVPDALDDAVAVLTEPYACCLHAVLRARVDALPAAETGEPPTALVMGCGAIGLLVIAAIRNLGYDWRLVAVAKHQHQQDHARRLGADDVLGIDRDVSQRYRRLAEALHAEIHTPEIGKPTVIGGAQLTFDCVASSDSIDDCCRLTTAGGQLILVGMPGIPSDIDWTAIWYQELTVAAAYAYGQEQVHGGTHTTFELALAHLLRHGDALRPLVGDPVPLTDYRRALGIALNTGRTRSVKTVLANR